MPDLLVRGVSTEVKNALSNRASRNGRSMQAEVKVIIKEAVATSASQSSTGEKTIEPAPSDAGLKGLSWLDEEELVAERIRKRKKILKALESVNASVDYSLLPSAAEVVASLRAEADEDDGRWVVAPCGTIEGGMA